MRSMKTGTLRGSQVAGRLLECVQSLVPFRVTIGYDFSSLEKAIQKADELISEADELAGRTAAKESAFAAVRVLLVQLAKSVRPSRKFQRLVVNLSETLCGLDEVGLRLQWSSDGKDEFYNAVLWGSETMIDELLERFTEDLPDDDLRGPIEQ